MKYKFLRLSLLGMLVMFFGGLAYAQDETIDFSALGYDNAAEVTTVKGTDVTLTFDKGTNSNTPKYYTTGTAVRLYGGNTLKVSSSTKTIEKVVFTFDGSNNLNDPTVDEGSYDSETSTWTGSASEFTITRGGTSGHARIQKMEFYYAAGGEADTRTATTLTLGEHQTTGVVGESMNLPTVTVATADGAPMENAEIEWTSSNTDVATITDGIISFNATGTTTVKASFAGDDNYKASSASFTLTVTAAPYTSIAAMLADITSTRTTVIYQFENLLVTYVNGPNTFVSDGRNGFLFYGSNLGLNAGEQITGTATGQLYTYYGLPEMSLSADGISAEVVSESNLVAWTTITAADLQSYVNIPVTIEDAVYVEASGKNLTFKVGEETLSVYNNWSINVTALEADKAYTLTGIGSVYSRNETTTYQLYLVSFEEKAEEGLVGWRDIKVDLTNGNLLEESEKVQWGAVGPFGIAVAEDGTVSRVAADAANAACTVQGKWHSTNYGWSGLVVTVPVEGPVKVTYGLGDFSGDVTIKDEAGNETTFNIKGTTWNVDNPDRVAFAYYRGLEPTTLTISGGSYQTYFAIEAVDPADLPEEVTEYTVSFAKGDAEGIAPADIKVEAGQPAFIPANTTLFVEGKTLTGWEYEGQVYAAGEEITVSNDAQLTPVFTDNTVAFNDRTEAVTVTWNATQKTGGAPLIGIEGKTGFIVGQAVVNGETIDMKLTVDATSGKFNNSNGEWIQVNNGTKFILPACKGASYSIYTMGDSGENTFNGEKGEYANNHNTYTYDGTEETMEIVVGGGSWYKAITATYPVVEQDEPGDEPGEFTFRDFAVELNSLLTDEDGATVTFGLAVAEDGTVSRVDAETENAAAVVTGATGNNHGLQRFSATVPVEGPVQITMGTCSWGGEVTVKNADGETVVTFTTKKGDGGTGCYKGNGMQDENIVSAKYVGDATTLTIEGGAYVNFFAVQAVDASSVTIDYAMGDVECQGDILPTGGTFAAGDEYTIPAQNFTLYKEGYTLTGWSDGENTYATGQAITLSNDMTLTPVFTENEVSLADRTEAVTLNFSFRRDQGAPTVQWQNTNGHVWVTQAEVNGKTIDVPMTIDTNPGKFNNAGNTDCAQTNNGTVFTVPSCKGAEVTLECHGSFSISTTTIDGQTDYEGSGTSTIKQTIASSAETVEIVIGDGSYYRYVKVVLPVVEQQGGGEAFENEVATIVWPFNNPNDIAAYTATPAEAFVTVAANTGDIELTGTGTGQAKYPDGSTVTFAKLKPSGSTQAVEWAVKPAAGLTFTPTKVSAYIARFGTDAENGITITAKAGDGETITLGNFTAPRNNKSQADDKYGSSSNYTNQFIIELTEAQQAALTSADGLSVFGTVGVGSGKEGGYAEMTIEGLVNGTKADVALYTLAVAASPEEAGSINVYPAADQYEEGSEVTLTATENFGYDFVNWTNAEGEEVSTEAKFKYTVNSDETLTANFVQVETYELALTVDGTNDYMVTISPAPTVVDGKNMYEAGQAVQLTANQYEGLVTFTNWSDGETNSSKLVSMSEDINITAYYAEADIIAGWDFYKSGGSGRKADFAAQDNDGDALNLVNTESGETSGWLDKSTLGGGGYESFAGAAVNWRTGASNGDVGNWHWQTKVNAAAFQDINVQFQMLYNYNAYQTYDAEYSLDGESWTKFGSITMTGAKAVASFSEQLPAEANNQAELYIRMLADKTSSIDGTGSANDGNTLAMFFITGTPQLVDDGTAPVLVSSVPAEGAVGASASGKIVLTFDERVKVADGATATLGTIELTPVVSGKTVTFAYKGLEYSTEYTFTLPANSVADLTDNFIAEPITIGFTTMVRPSVEKGLYDYVVEDVDGLMAAISASEARADKNVRYRIFIKNGEYTIPLSSTIKTVNGYEVPECITFLKASNVSFIGESRDGVIITNGIDKSETFDGTYGKTSKYDGIGNSDVFQIQSSVSGLYWQDLTVETGMDDATGRDLAIQDKGTKNVYKNVGLRGFQDTWTSNNDNGLYYFEDGYVRGRTDYMCGKGDIFWNRVELRQIAGGYAAVPSKPKQYGWIYKDCTINGEAAVVNAATGETRTAAQVDGNYTLGRPWGSGTPIALFIDTKMNVVPSAIGWNEMSGGWPARFAEYNSMTSTGTVIDLSGRKKTFGDGHENNPVLTAEEALENSDLHRMYGDWDPTLLTEQAPVPANVRQDGNDLVWDNSNYALLWAVVKDGAVIGFTTEPKYELPSNGVYAVRAANEMGGLSEASETVTASGVTTGIFEAVNPLNAVPETIYNINGIRVQKAQKGLYIINGRKVVK